MVDLDKLKHTTGQDLLARLSIDDESISAVYVTAPGNGNVCCYDVSRDLERTVGEAVDMLGSVHEPISTWMLFVVGEDVYTFLAPVVDGEYISPGQLTKDQTERFFGPLYSISLEGALFRYNRHPNPLDLD
ncbi:hypothetical protein HN419_07265 [Candidatus Woesearchaeota archaeon]|jgi:hypothetical protein|nr:hypothetical protein [Candidatus Woesearchaeota archaeon]MBT3538292.1 hypothetical protein [Candidatus Woesearchaeota archaeon]MBT4696714.1 hypothetical protein [Candidatus Woesearchaeota archaeon]MBT4716832.1 hypothetical protein [Candidatus Woesearchaeota archaeon]MBT7105961.1 hypothetical protein [Candidatus Woesearchaeota archaeon]